MATIRSYRVAALLAIGALTGIIAACGEDAADLRIGPSAVNPIFERYVALGNAITAGYQSGGINDSTQRESYARLVAQQMRTRYAYASLAGFGCPAPVVDFTTQARKGAAAATDCALRSTSSATAILNNVAVPGATVIDPFATTTPFSNTLTTLILGGKTQVAKALDASPTFVSVWIGNNDVLDAAAKGVTRAVAALRTPGITDTTAFRNSYRTMINALRAQPGLKGILIGVVNATQIPLLFPAESLLTNPTLKAQFDAGAGGAVTVLANCVGSRALVSAAVMAQMKAGTFPRIVGCVANQPQAPIGDFFVLDTIEQRVFATSVSRYNAYISAKADSSGFAYIDPNPLLTRLRGIGAIPAIPNLASQTAPFGAFLSLDGAHPSGAAHREIARAVITAINTKYSTSIPQLP